MDSRSAAAFASVTRGTRPHPKSTMRQGRLTVILTVLNTCWLLGASEAQTRVPAGRFSASLDGGFQSGSENLIDNATTVLYDEEYSTETAYQIDRSGGLFRASAGLLLWRNFGFAVGFTRSSSTGAAEVTADVPHPLFFARPRAVSATVSAMAYRENIVHVQAVAAVVVSNKVELTLFGGPSRVTFDQAIVTRAGIDPSTEVAPYTTIEFSDVVVTELRDSRIAFNLGIDLSYMWTPSLGFGSFVQYTTGSNELTLNGGQTSVGIGGVQFGVGLRLRLVPN